MVVGDDVPDAPSWQPTARTRLGVGRYDCDADRSPFLGRLGGVQVVEISVEWLRAAVRMIETGSAEPAPVVHLVNSARLLRKGALETPPEPAE